MENKKKKKRKNFPKKIILTKKIKKILLIIMRIMQIKIRSQIYLQQPMIQIIIWKKVIL